MVPVQSSGLPIGDALPALKSVLASGNTAVLQAPPGAGKTTVVPLALLDEPWAAAGRIVMLEPRRLATRAAARRMAETLGQNVGETVGYRVRQDTRVGAATRIEVVTEGILTRQMLGDPELTGVSAVLFDEFHERSIHADLGLALCRDVQSALRPDLRLLVMSATLDAAAIAEKLDNAPVIRSEGRAHPVDIRHVDDLNGREPADVAEAVMRALGEESGSILVFLPGEREIRQTETLLRKNCPADTTVAPLYGALAKAEQDKAIQPAPQGRRKVVLATNIAETSLTIQGVRVVIDSGLARKPRYDPNSGMSRLETVKASKASLTQRTGRAGRTEPGVSVRLWPKAAEGALAAFEAPEIVETDLAPLALALLEWGVSDPADLTWLDLPPPNALAKARDLLRELGAVDAAGGITRHGRTMATLPLHPRLAHMVLLGHDAGLGVAACHLAAVLDEGDVLVPAHRNDIDLRQRLEALSGQTARTKGIDQGAAKRAKALSWTWQKRIGAKDAQTIDQQAAGRLLALAYPDRVALARPGQPGRFLMRNGRGADLPDDDPLAPEPCLAIAGLDGRQQAARIRRAAPLDKMLLEDLFGDQLQRDDIVEWDRRARKVRAEHRMNLGALVLKRETLSLPAGDDRVTAAMCAGIRLAGIDCLPWTDTAQQFRHRLAFAARHDTGTDWPDVGDAELLATLEQWLTPFLTGVSSLADLAGIDVDTALQSLLDWPSRSRLDEIAPVTFTLPSGRRLTIDYRSDPPAVASKLQDFFGIDSHPSLANGRVALSVQLLSPARRPVQVTTDLPGFWRGSYRDVRKDLRGRYPKHPWPVNPLEKKQP